MAPNGVLSLSHSWTDNVNVFIKCEGTRKGNSQYFHMFHS